MPKPRSETHEVFSSAKGNSNLPPSFGRVAWLCGWGMAIPALTTALMLRRESRVHGPG